MHYFVFSFSGIPRLSADLEKAKILVVDPHLFNASG
jgi:hypothetical protein